MASEHGFGVGDRVRVSKAEDDAGRYAGQRGAVRPRDGECLVYRYLVNLDGDRTPTLFHSRELEPLTEVWKVVRVVYEEFDGEGDPKPMLVSAFQGTTCGSHSLGPRQTYALGKEVEQAVAYLDRARAEGWIARAPWGGARSELWRAEGIVSNDLPPSIVGASCRHLMLVERVAVYRDGKEVVVEDAPAVDRMAEPVEEKPVAVVPSEIDAINAVLAGHGYAGHPRVEAVRDACESNERLREELLLANTRVAASHRYVAEGFLAAGCGEDEDYKAFLRRRTAELEALAIQCHAALDREGAAGAKLAVARKRCKALEATERQLRVEAVETGRILSAVRRAEDHERGQASELRGKLAHAEDMDLRFREHWKAVFDRRDDDEVARVGDARVVEAAVALVRPWSTLEALGENARALRLAVQAHPSYQAAEAEPAPERERRCANRGCPVMLRFGSNPLCVSCSALRARLNRAYEGNTS